MTNPNPQTTPSESGGLERKGYFLDELLKMERMPNVSDYLQEYICGAYRLACQEIGQKVPDVWGWPLAVVAQAAIQSTFDAETRTRVEGECQGQTKIAESNHKPEQETPRLSELTRWPARGDKMIFLGKNGYESELKEALLKFVVNREYTVKSCDVQSWSHSIVFEEVAGHFNGVMFAQLTPDTPSSRDPSLHAEPLSAPPSLDRKAIIEECARVAENFKGGFTANIFEEPELVRDKDGKWGFGPDIASAIRALANVSTDMDRKPNAEPQNK